MVSSQNKARYVIGIDLGTTNCVLCYVDTLEELPKPRILPVKQWESANTLIEDASLPSFYYLPPKNEWKKGQFDLTLQRSEPIEYVVGRLARQQSNFTPGRVVHSAKSWLCHGGVNRQERILPWHSDEIIGDDRRSPIEVSAAYLRHLKEAWHEKMGADENGFNQQDIVITVPASFDEIAQRLTLDAAKLAEYPLDRVQLLEEPQAAFYHWLATKADDTGLTQALLQELPALHERPQTILICDVGGGTSDFSLFKISSLAGNPYPEISRIAVSDHLLLGGDNIDLSIAHALEQKLTAGSGRLESKQWAQLVFESRKVKERALTHEETAEKEFFVSIAGGGSSLFGNTLTVNIIPDEIKELVLNGFLPPCEKDEKPQKKTAVLKEWGLPYPHDSAITRHLAGFIKQADVDAILFTGGTLKPGFIQERIKGVIDSWREEKTVLLNNDQMDLAVALGAAYCGFVRRAPERRIKSGYARSLYVEARRPNREPVLVCLIPRGYESHEPLRIDQHLFKAVLGEPVRFQLFTSNMRSQDKLGDIISYNADELRPLPALNTRLEKKTVERKSNQPETIDVYLKARIHESGILELYCVHRDEKEEESWGLNFDIRQVSSESVAIASEGPVLAVSPEKLSQARDLIDYFYGKKKVAEVAKRHPKNIMKDLETIFGPRQEWDTTLLRHLWEHVKDGMTRRGRSVNHESSWLYLAGFTLRPGFGAPLDEWRVADLWRVYDLGMVNPKEIQVEEQWWLMWRRAAGGLGSEQQEKIFDRIFPAIRNSTSQSKELYLLAGSLERMEMKKKIRLGNILVQQIVSGKKDFLPAKIWALARIANRIPLYGGPQNVIRQKFVTEWINLLLPLQTTNKFYSGLNFFYSQAGRLIQDREFDLESPLRERLVLKMKTENALPEQIEGVEHYKPVDLKDRNLAFGEELPAGLILDS